MTLQSTQYLPKQKIMFSSYVIFGVSEFTLQKKSYLSYFVYTDSK